MSGELTRSLLNELDPSGLGDLGREMQARAQWFEAHAKGFAHDLRFPGGGEEWTGDGSDALQGKAQPIGSMFGSVDHKLITAAYWCFQAEEHVGHGKSALQGKVAEVNAEPVRPVVDGKAWDCGEPFTVDDDFSVRVLASAIPAGAPPEVAQGLAAAAAARTATLQDMARQLEETSDDHLAKIRAALDVTGLARNSRGEPYPRLGSEVRDVLDGKKPLPTDLKQLRDFWKSLTAQEKAAVFEKYPHIGDHDGIPAADQDSMNRSTMAREFKAHQDMLASARQQRAELEAQAARDGVPPDHIAGYAVAKKTVEVLEKQVAAEEKFRNDIADVSGYPHNFLLQRDGKGHAIVATGNPDTAKNAVTLVLGTGEHLDSMDRGLDRARSTFKSAFKHGSPWGGTSVIAWYGYDAPDWPTGPVSSDAAKAGAGALNQFQEGLRVTHEGEPSHNTVFGHSYGTTVIGEAASHGRTLNVDDVGFLGSPGLDVPSVRDLSLTGVNADQVVRHVWAGADVFDPVPVISDVPVSTPDRSLPGVPHIPDQFPELPKLPFPLSDFPLWPSSEEVTPHDLPPTDPRFGLPQEQIIPVDPHPPTDPTNPASAHSQYWDEASGKNSAWDKLGEIINRPKT